MQSNNPARYEFRIFGERSLPAGEHMRSWAKSIDSLTSRDTYIVSRLTIDASVKIRDASIEVKTLVARHRLLELWQLELVQHLPLSRHDFTEAVAPRLGLNLNSPKKPSLTEADLLEFCRLQPALLAATVEKDRRILALPAGRGELTSLQIGAHRAQSLAIESSDASYAEDMIDRLGVSAIPNESYPVYIQRLLF